ncbi:NAD(P)(+) transhydrogenase (Re/Si-specific) subunit beta [Phytohabitans houttuyneae]|uniref:NAD(P) transhydrogenase subunit beta n=1 Tax=Phytohabitans houttuyneae TaxID=1076126 RepID=A0A6V8KJV3_9ACTN|nr:NAD(P)(+) transhydrogenase (Re/Si-specific) subunit beta [Phytohabitans houttuyneae]GFJ80955.1 NAD(P) transhydrogenase subunit beta [Phytohabitans houttuyneae]
MSTVETVVRLAYLAAATCFVLGLHLMNTPATARRGNRLSIAGMLLAVAATLVLLVDSGDTSPAGWIVLAAGAVVGSVAGLWAARAVPMTAMPQLVSLFNAVGGGAAALVAIPELAPPADAASVRVPAALDVVIGALTFAGSLVAAGKLQGLVPGRPVLFPGARVVGGALAVIGAVAAGVLVRGYGGGAAVAVLAAAALALGVALVLPIGGADMPVVISLLNACTGTAVAMAGFVTDNSVLVVAGALVGASGAILTALMAAAMNRSLAAILLGGYGTGDGASGPSGSGGAPVRAVTADDAAIQLAYARRVVVVPGYGLAAAQAQHALHELATVLSARGTEVTYAIHPVAGRMPGHMNVLLAEANIPYSDMQELDAANAALPLADVALVVGANDVTNPAARRPGNAISGMPILDVDRAAAVIVVKRSMGHGYAGIDNELYTDPKTGMLFADARAGLAALTAAVKTLVG